MWGKSLVIKALSGAILWSLCWEYSWKNPRNAPKLCPLRGSASQRPFSPGLKRPRGTPTPSTKPPSRWVKDFRLAGSDPSASCHADVAVLPCRCCWGSKLCRSRARRAHATSLRPPSHTPVPPRRPPAPLHALRERRDVVERIEHWERAKRQSRDLARQQWGVHSCSTRTLARTPATSRMLGSSAAVCLGGRDDLAPPRAKVNSLCALVLSPLPWLPCALLWSPSPSKRSLSLDPFNGLYNTEHAASDASRCFPSGNFILREFILLVLLFCFLHPKAPVSQPRLPPTFLFSLPPGSSRHGPCTLKEETHCLGAVTFRALGFAFSRRGHTFKLVFKCEALSLGAISAQAAMALGCGSLKDSVILCSEILSCNLDILWAAEAGPLLAWVGPEECEEFGEFGSVPGKNRSALWLGGGEPGEGSEQSGGWAKSRGRCKVEAGPIKGLQGGELGGSCLCHAHKPASCFCPCSTRGYWKG